MIEHKIKFGTDGWRAIIAENYTVENVARVSEATAKWVKTNFLENPTIVVGHDCRYAGELFAETATKVFINHGIKVILAKDFVSTPMVSLACVKLKASLGVVITASHNPPTYNGYKLKGHFGGPLPPAQVQEVQDMIPDTADKSFEKIELDAGESKTVSFKITPKMLEFTGITMEKVLEAGDYTVMLGTSSQNYLETKFKLKK